MSYQPGYYADRSRMSDYHDGLWKIFRECIFTFLLRESWRRNRWGGKFLCPGYTGNKGPQTSFSSNKSVFMNIQAMVLVIKTLPAPKFSTG